MAAVINVELQTDPGVTPTLSHAAVEAARLIRQGRDRLLTTAGCITVEMLSEGRMSTTNASRQWLHRHRSQHRLVTVEHQGTTLIPTFQLTDAFDVDGVIAAITERLVGGGMTSWAIWRWFTSHNTFIDATPLTALQTGNSEGVERAVEGLLG